MKSGYKKLLDTISQHSVGDSANGSFSRFQEKQLPAAAELLVAIADDADRMTRRIVCLTWGLILLTVVLLAATVVLAYIAHRTDERIRQIYEIANQPQRQYQHNATAPQKP